MSETIKAWQEVAYYKNKCEELAVFKNKYEDHMTTCTLWHEKKNAQIKELEKQIALYKTITDALGYRVDGGVIIDERFRYAETVKGELK